MLKTHRFTLISLYVLLCSLSSQAYADTKNYQDYRAPQVSSELAHMQNFHLQNAQDKLRKQQLSYAWGDFAYLLCQMPNHHIALQHMQELALQLNKQDELIKYFDNGIKTFPQDAILHALYAKFLLKLGNQVASKEMLDKALAIQPDLSQEYLLAD